MPGSRAMPFGGHDRCRAPGRQAERVEPTLRQAVAYYFVISQGMGQSQQLVLPGRQTHVAESIICHSGDLTRRRTTSLTLGLERQNSSGKYAKASNAPASIMCPLPASIYFRPSEIDLEAVTWDVLGIGTFGVSKLVKAANAGAQAMDALQILGGFTGGGGSAHALSSLSANRNPQQALSLLVNTARLTPAPGAPPRVSLAWLWIWRLVFIISSGR